MAFKHNIGSAKLEHTRHGSFFSDHRQATHLHALLQGS